MGVNFVYSLVREKIEFVHIFYFNIKWIVYKERQNRKKQDDLKKLSLLSVPTQSGKYGSQF